MTKEQEAIEIIDKMIKSYIEADECGLSNNDYKDEIEAMQTVLNIIKEKDKRIKELEEENIILRKANNTTRDLIEEVKIEDITQVINKSYEEFVNQFIAKQKVKDKIKELANTKGDLATYIAVSERIKVLEELLEEKNDRRKSNRKM